MWPRSYLQDQDHLAQDQRLDTQSSRYWRRQVRSPFLYRLITARRSCIARYLPWSLRGQQLADSSSRRLQWSHFADDDS